MCTLEKEVAIYLQSTICHDHSKSGAKSQCLYTPKHFLGNNQQIGVAASLSQVRTLIALLPAQSAVHGARRTAQLLLWEVALLNYSLTTNAECDMANSDWLTR